MSTRYEALVTDIKKRRDENQARLKALLEQRRAVLKPIMDFGEALANQKVIHLAEQIENDLDRPQIVFHLLDTNQKVYVQLADLPDSHYSSLGPEYRIEVYTLNPSNQKKQNPESFNVRDVGDTDPNGNLEYGQIFMKIGNFIAEAN